MDQVHIADPLAHRVQRAQEVVAERPHIVVGLKGEPAAREHYRCSGRGIGIADSLAPGAEEGIAFDDRRGDTETDAVAGRGHPGASGLAISEERRVGNECVSSLRSWWSPIH